MKEEFTLSVFTENKIGLLHRVSIIFTRRYINIESITASESELKDVHRYTIVVKETEEMVKKVVKQLEKQIDVVKAFYHRNAELVYQEIALFKMATKSVFKNNMVENSIRMHNARVLSMQDEFTVIEKTGTNEETQLLFNELAPYGILEFVRSGRVAITKPMKELKSYLNELELASFNNFKN